MTPEMVKEARTTLGLTHKKFGERIGVSERTVFRWESGESTPRPGDAMLIGELVKKKSGKKK